MRCFQGALVVYQEKGWSIINDVLNYATGERLFQKGLWDEAMGHFVTLLHASRQSKELQAVYFEKFLETFKVCACTVSNLECEYRRC
jgi:hypothetical protein